MQLVGRQRRPTNSRYRAGVRSLALLLTLLVFAPTGAAAGTPSLQAVSTQPLDVHGVRFRPTERVIVRVVAAGSVRVHIVRATPVGTFTTRFTAVTLERCTAWVVTARGSKGSTAAIRPRRFEDCAPL